MSEEQLKAFVEKVKADTELQDKLNEAASPEAAMEIAKAAGFAITAEDIQSMQSKIELSDEELEGAAGGFCFFFPRNGTRNTNRNHGGHCCD